MRRARQAQSRSKLQCGHDPEAVENGRSRCRSTGGTPRFNAATTRRPWRAYEPACVTSGLTIGFNAATARRPWRTPACDVSIVARRDASMRPRPGGRGEPAVRSADRRRRGGFNAATTRRPWRTHRAGQRGVLALKLQCGHDPKAVENRDVAASAGRGQVVASMRPRPEGRGERPDRLADLVRSPSLQCGHDPKAVENADGGHSDRRCCGASMRPRPEGRGERRRLTDMRSCPTRLQCGHDPKAVENLGRPVAHRPSSAGASMRPRPEGRGEQRDADVPGSPTRRASMRPRPEGRGEPHDSRPRSYRQHGFNAATTRRPWRTARRRASPVDVASKLQCGHDPKAVENARTPAASSTASSRASMRPRPGGRGERDAGSPGTTRRRRASMRPRPEGRGELPGRRAPPTRPCSFNAATTRRPWRTSRLSVTRAVDGRLQCGHDPKAVENGGDAGPDPGGPLQCGHDPKAVENEARAAAVRRRRASMRPRPEGRGERACTPASLTSAQTLQCGHDPKAVENARRRQGAPRRRRELQCGHDPKAVENAAASALTQAESAQLQCGHDPEAVENAVVRDRTTHVTALQCGHDPEAVENATMRRRSSGRPTELQCGHDPEAVENALDAARR